MNRLQGLSRRGFTGSVAAIAAAFAVRPAFAAAAPSQGRYRATASGILLQDAPDGPFELPPLEYDFDALEPHIDALTMEIHHDRHHMAFINNLNTIAADNDDVASMTAEEIVQNLDQFPEDLQTPLRNNAGGHLNHTMFWEIMGPDGGGEPTGDLADAIESDLGGFDAAVEAVTAAGVARFGSGWAWIVANDGTLEVISTPNQDSPLMDDMTPILGVDVWEHAYYLMYQNMRPAYLEAWWNTVNWDAVGERFDAAMA